MTHPDPTPLESKRAAIAFILLASLLVAGTTLLAKALGTDTLGEPLHPLQISHGRFLFAWVTVVCAVALLRPKFTSPHWRLHTARSAFGYSGITLLFAAVAFIPIADATAISFLNPVFAMILAIPLLGERVGKIRWLAAAIALTGALILLRPGSSAFQPAALLAFAAAIVMGVEITIIKLLTGREAPLQILFINNSIGVIIATSIVVFVWSMPTAAQWTALAGLGMMMAAAQTCFIQAMRRAESSFVAPFSYATLIFASFYDAVLFGTLPDSVSLIGAAIIVAGAALLAYREARAANQALVTPPKRP
ncbi:MAG: DMT family transporter [Pseudomonadota bacterium]